MKRIQRMFTIILILNAVLFTITAGAEKKIGFSAFVLDDELTEISEELCLQQRIFLLNEDLSYETSVKTQNGSFVIRDLKDPEVIYSVSNPSYTCLSSVSYEYYYLNTEHRIVRYTIDENGKWSAKTFREDARYVDNSEVIIALDGIDTPYTLSVPDFYDEPTIYISKGADYYKEIKRCYEERVCYEGRNAAAWKWPTAFTAVSTYDKIAVAIADSWHIYTYLYIYDMETCTVSKVGEHFDILGPICWYDEENILACVDHDGGSLLSLININTSEIIPFTLADGYPLSMEDVPYICMVLSDDRSMLAYWTDIGGRADGDDNLALNILDLTSGERKILFFPVYSGWSVKPYGRTYSREIGDTQIFVPVNDYVPLIFFME